jgi:multiple sugar transport system permease protein
MMAPMIAVLLAFTVYPFLAILWFSTHAYDLTQPDQTGFVGLENFRDALATPGFAHSAVITGLFVAVTVGIQFPLGFGVAALLWRPLRGARFYIAMLALPFAATPIATYLGWRLMLNPGGGQFNVLLQSLGLPQLPWTSSPELAFVSLMLVDIWTWTPFVALVMLAGFYALPDAPFEAAAIDGAGFFKSVMLIAFPILRPLAAFVIMFRVIDAFRAFDVIWIITGGGPGDATETLTVRTYRAAFLDLDIGVASALSLVLLVSLVLLGRLLFVRIMEVMERT